jgi:hypothetical protein
LHKRRRLQQRAARDALIATAGASPGDLLHRVARSSRSAAAPVHYCTSQHAFHRGARTQPMWQSEEIRAPYAMLDVALRDPPVPIAPTAVDGGAQVPIRYRRGTAGYFGACLRSRMREATGTRESGT